MPTLPSPVAAIQQAIDGFFKAAYTGGLDVAWEDTVYRPTPGTPYLATSMPARTSQAMTPGAIGPVEWRGTYQINVFYPVGTGLVPVASAADAIANLFPRGTAISVEGHTEQIKIQLPRVVPGVQQPDWILVPVQIDWTFIQA